MSKLQNLKSFVHQSLNKLSKANVKLAYKFISTQVINQVDIIQI